MPLAPLILSGAPVPAAFTSLNLLQSTAANMGAAAGISVRPGKQLVGDIKFSTVTTTETMAVSATDVSSGATIPASALWVIDLSTGNQVHPTALATGNYSIPFWQGNRIIGSLIFTKSAAVNAGSVAVAAPYDFPANL